MTDPFLSRNPLRAARGYVSFLQDFARYQKQNHADALAWLDLYPCVTDRFDLHPLDHSYFYQDTWAARKIFEAQPRLHVDIGSTTLFVGMLSQFTSVVSVDIRPLPVRLQGLYPLQGSILQMPLANDSISSLSSLCVIEHIGLGRYGDPIEPQGTVRAAQELTRVLARGGNLYVSVPVEQTNRVHFNAHRAFAVEPFTKLFQPLQVRETRFIQGDDLLPHATLPDWASTAPPIVGLFHLTKP